MQETAGSCLRMGRLSGIYITRGRPFLRNMQMWRFAKIISVWRKLLTRWWRLWLATVTNHPRIAAVGGRPGHEPEHWLCYYLWTNRPLIVTHPAYLKVAFSKGLDVGNHHFIARMPCSGVQGSVNNNLVVTKKLHICKKCFTNRGFVIYLWICIK